MSMVSTQTNSGSVDDATTDPGYGSGWFKIQEAGYNAASESQS